MSLRLITKLFVTTSTPKIKSGFCEIDTFKLYYYDHQYLFEFIFWSSYRKWRKAKVDMNNNFVILLLFGSTVLGSLSAA